MPAKNSPTDPQKPPLSSPFPIAGKPWQRRFPTPRIEDYIVSVREDTRRSEFAMPEKGDIYRGTDQQKRLSQVYRFATAVPVEQMPEWVDLYYIAPFQNQDEYNYTVEYPYNDKNYPRFTRVYVVLRNSDSAIMEPQADTFDPVFGRPFQLTDHKIERFTDDAVMDSVFVKVSRQFERLPSPIITSFESNQFQQVVTVKTQEVMSSVPPPQSAFTEGMKQERSGTAKAKNTLSAVPRVFPNQGLTTEIPSMTRELWLGGFDEETITQIEAGQATQPVLDTPGDYSITEKQLTEFKKEVTVKLLPLPQDRHHNELTSEFGGGVLVEDMFIDTPTSGLTIDEGYLVTESRLRNLPGFGLVKMTKRLSDSDEWPELVGVVRDPTYGIRVWTAKKFVPAGTRTPAPMVSLDVTDTAFVFTDIQEHEKWRSIQIASKVDPSSLPIPLQIPQVFHITLPPELVDIGPMLNSDKYLLGQTQGYSVGGTVTITNEIAGAGMVMTSSSYSGPVNGFKFDAFSLGVPNLATLFPTIFGPGGFKLLSTLPVVGKVIVVGQYLHASNSFPVLAASLDVKSLVHSTVVGPCLTGKFISNAFALGTIKPVRIPATFAREYDLTADTDKIQSGIGSGAYELFTNAYGDLFPAKARVIINIPRSNPPSFADITGQQFIYQTNVERWRFNVFHIEAEVITIPDLNLPTH